MKKITFFILMGLVSIQAYANSYGFGGVNQLPCTNVTNGDFTFSDFRDAISAASNVQPNADGTIWGGISVDSGLTKRQRTVGKNSWRICKGFYRDIEDAQRKCRKVGETIYKNLRRSTSPNVNWNSVKNSVKNEVSSCGDKMNTIMGYHNNL